MTMLSVIVEELGFGREQRRERPISIHVPYLRHVSDTVIGLESGAILSIVKLDGLFFQTEDQAEINMRADRPEHDDPRARFEPVFGVVDRHSQGRSSLHSGARFSDAVLRPARTSRYMASLRDKRMFTNDLYLTIVRSGMRGALGAAETFSRPARRSSGPRGRRANALHERINELEEVVGNVVRELQKYGARPLGIIHLEGRPLLRTVRLLQHDPDLRNITSDAAAAHGNPKLRRDLAPAFLKTDHAGAGTDRSG